MESSHIPYDQLIAYAAGELDQAASAAVTAHTNACSECTTTLVWFRKVRGLMRTDPTREPPPTAVARAQAIFSGTSTRPESRLPRLSFPPLFQAARRFSAASVLAGVLVVLVLFFGGVGAAAAAAKESLPGDTFYPVKIAVESLQLAVTLDPVNKAELHLELAQVRVMEVEALDAKGEDENIPATARAYANHLSEAGELLSSAKEENRQAAAVEKQMLQVVTESNAVLATLLNTLPAEARPAIASAIDASKSAGANAPYLQAGPIPSPSARGRPTVTLVPSATPTQPQEQSITSSGGQCAGSNPPSLTVTVSPSVLWPADHKYVTVTVKVNVVDNADPNPSVALISVTSNEPDSGQGDGDLPIDYVIVDKFSIQLRAERSGTGPGRVYTITYSATNACGKVKRASETVTVPHNQPAPGEQKTPQGQPSGQPSQGQPKGPSGQDKSP